MVLSTPRQSVCELEVDALAADILNRHELTLGKSKLLIVSLLSPYCSCMQCLEDTPAWLQYGKRRDREEQHLVSMYLSLHPPHKVGKSCNCIVLCSVKGYCT